MSWTEPENMGPPFTGSNIRYRKGNSGGYRTDGITITGITATIAPEDSDSTPNVDERLERNTSYEVQVRALNGELDTHNNWSPPATGRTRAGNREPVFNDRPDQEAANTPSTIDRTVGEETGPGQPVETAVRARDTGGTLTYKLVAADAPNVSDVSKFDINESTGQILTKEPLNHEDSDCGYGENDEPTTCTYMVKVEVRDGLDEHGNEVSETEADDIITVRILVGDDPEAPEAPTVTVTSSEVATDATVAMLTVTWDKPENKGPALTGYVVECTGPGIASASACTQPDSLNLNDEVLPYTIENLTPGSSYRVRVRADNDEGEGAWSTWESQSTSEAGNTVPSFASSQISLFSGGGHKFRHSDPARRGSGPRRIGLDYLRTWGPGRQLVRHRSERAGQDEGEPEL